MYFSKTWTGGSDYWDGILRGEERWKYSPRLLSQGVPDPQSNIQFSVVNPIALPVGSCDMQILRLVIKHIKTNEKFHIESLSEDYPGVCEAAGQTLNKKRCCLC